MESGKNVSPSNQSNPSTSERESIAAPVSCPGTRRGLEPIDTELIEQIIARRSDIKHRWRTLLGIEPVNSAMAHPEVLALMLDETLQRIFAALRSPRRRQAETKLACECGRNPFTAYFVAGRQALFEVLIEVQASMPSLSAAQRQSSLEKVKRAFEKVAHEEVDAFAAVCQHRSAPGAGSKT